jgi:crotonobetainyl-CoA:carnitine CoA-transferase CaiB-like acyl-CoA transferase
MTGICEGLNVVEMGSGSAAAAITGMVLADAGARVIKIEAPGGDRLRSINPSGFLVWNRGKESLVADLHTADGQDNARQLAQAADVLIEGFAPGVTRAWGVDGEALCTANPGLVHCSFSAFGRTGPYAKLKGLDSLVAAKVGLWSRGGFGYRDGGFMYPVPWASYGAAMQAVAGIVGALLVRDETGRGQQIEATLFAGLEPLDYFVQTIVQLMAKQGEVPAGDARTATAASRYGVLVATRDGRFIQTSTLLPHQGKALCEVAGIAHVLDDPRFARLPMFDTVDDAQEWENQLLEAFRAEDLDYWLPRLEASPDIAFEIAITSEQGLEHPQIVHNGDAITIEDPTVGPVREVGPIAHFARTPIVPTRSAPEVGANRGPFEAHPFPAGNGRSPEHPLAGTTIVEFGYFYAMPYAVTMAASLGARVIKIEDGKGDPYRTAFGPEVASNKTMAGKESVSVDLSTPEGRAIAQKIVSGADVFVTGFRSGIADKLGLGYEELSKLNPRLVYLHAAGYGADGPYAHRALYAQAAQAVAGSFGRQVGHWSDPALNVGMSLMELQVIVLPRLGQVVDGDSNAALAVLASLALAIYDQRRTGKGQKVVSSMIAGNAWAYSDDFCKYEGKPPAQLCDSECYGTSALDRLYRAADKTWVCLAVRDDTEFSRLAAAVDLAELASDERFHDIKSRAENDDALIDILAERFATRTALEWESMLTAADVGCVETNMQGHPVVTVFDPALREAGLTLEFEHPLFGELVRAAPPIKFSETPARVAPPCFRGQHNRTVLAEIGYSEEDIVRLESDGVVIPPS